MTRRLASMLRRLADRLDPDGQMRAPGLSFSFRDRVGIVFHRDERGCPLWYRAGDYGQAHDPKKYAPGDHRRGSL